MNAIDHPKEKKRINTAYFENLLKRTQPLYELLPCFQYNSDPFAYGKFPPSPQGKDEVVSSIIHVWRNKVVPACIFFRDGNNKNSHIDNIQPLDFTTALRHVDKYVTDWDLDLDTNQIQYVKSNIQYFIDLTKVIFRRQSFCHNCEKYNPQYCCGGCKQAYYCGKDCQNASWKSHHRRKCKNIKYTRKPSTKPVPEMAELCLDVWMLHVYEGTSRRMGFGGEPDE
jgi:hypothetical protein